MFVTVTILLQFLLVQLTNGGGGLSVQDIVALKRKTSQVMSLSGTPFAQDITKIPFDNDDSWLDLQLTPSYVERMNFILDGQMKLINDSKSLASFNAMQVIVTTSWKTDDIFQRAVIPFSMVGFSAPEQDIIRQVVHNINLHFNWWCFRLEETKDTKNPSTIVFQKSTEAKYCGSSPIGRQLTNNIMVSCVEPKVIMRLTVHALGMVNLIWRNDRIRFVNIDWSNIKDQYKYNFYPWNFDFVSNLDGLLFDYDSIMNTFPFQAYAINTSKPVVTKRRKNVDVGNVNDDFLSNIDVEWLQNTYPNSGCSGQPCWDHLYSCPLWAQVGYCSTNNTSFQQQFFEQCRFSCNQCQLNPADQTTCKDLSELCLDWKNDGYCDQSSRFFSYLSKVCRLSCKLCQ